MVSSKRLAANLISGVSTNIARVLIQLIMLPLIARLLGPTELGLYALAIPMINFVMLLSDAGVGDSLAKEKSNDPAIWSSAFWGVIGISTLAAIIVYLASFWVATAAGQPRLPAIILPLASTLLLMAMTIVPTALMLRSGSMMFGSLADLAAVIVSAGIAIAMALSGWGVWALVAQTVTSCLVRAIGYNVIQPFVPRRLFNARLLLSHTGMGGQILAARLLDLAVSMFERSRISTKLGPAAVGSYANAYQIGMFTSNALGSPLWANLYYIAIQKPRSEIPIAFVRAHRLFALIVFPVAMIMAVNAPAMVPLLLGARWAGSVGCIIALVLTSPLGNMAAFHSAVFYAWGLGRYVLLGQAAIMVLRIAVVLFFWEYGIVALSLGFGMTSVIYYLATNTLASRHIGCSPRDLFGVAALPALASIAIGVSLRRLEGPTPSLLAAIAASLCAFALYGVLLCLFDRKHLRADIDAALATLGRRGVARFA